MKIAPLVLSLLLSLSLPGLSQTPLVEAKEAPGVKVHYQLPTTGPLPRTYRVTLAVVDGKDPKWVICNFASGVVRTVTAENKGEFSEVWNGLDDNYMPVPPGTYGIKGIYMPAEKWKIDGEYHSITARLAGSGNSWAQSPQEDALPNKLVGDPVGTPLRAVDVAPNGKGVVYFQYFENGTNNLVTDFTQPIGYNQIIKGFGSGSAAGGMSTCTDGETIWSFSTDAGPVFIYRADAKPFGTQSGAGRKNVYVPEGWITGLAAWKETAAGGSVVFASQRGKVISDRPRHFTESSSEFVDVILALDGSNAQTLAQWKLERPMSVKARRGKLYALHATGDKYEVLSLPLDANWKKAQFSLLFTVPKGITPFDVDADSHGRVSLSDSKANHVYQFDVQGKLLRTYGQLAAQKEGHYDPQSFMAPEKIACWTDAQGRDRLLIVEVLGPNRLSEWDAEGKMIRQWVTPQTSANGGYAVDPRHPDLLYLPGPNLHSHKTDPASETLVRWKVNYTTGEWTVDAVWTHVGTWFFDNKYTRYEWGRPTVVYHGEDLYLGFSYSQKSFLYRLDGERFVPSMAFFVEGAKGMRTVSIWRDINGDGRVQEEEYRPFPTELPKGVMLGRTFGDFWFDDLSIVMIGQGTPFIWKLTPTGFDEHKNPIYDPKGWTKVLTDDVFVDKNEGRATAIRGGNEVGTSFSSDWSGVASAPDGGCYVGARSGPNFTANFGSQYKLSRYVPDGKGGLVQQWRVGRITLQTTASPGQVYGPIFVSSPINGLVGVVDNSRAGVVVYTDEGLYVDTMLADEKLVSADQRGAYWVPGEYFSGYNYLNRDNGKVYLALGKWMPVIYEAAGWTAKETVVHPLTTADKTVTLAANQIGMPPEIALTVRGGAAASRVARYYPAPGGGPALDASMEGWEGCDPVKFTDGQGQNVEARCLYDPEHLYIRWQVQLNHALNVKPLLPLEHLFAHDRGADTLGLYLQGDPNAAPGGKFPCGRPGDVRLVFGVFNDGKAERPVVLGMYPKWGGQKGSPVTYNTAQTTPFENVALVPGVVAKHKVEADGKSFVIVASIPRAALPGNGSLDGLRTTGNFDANLGGGNRFWWSNADGSASRETFDEPTEARLFPGSWSSIQFLSMETLPIRSWMAIGPFGDAAMAHLESQKNGDQVVKILWAAKYPPDSVRDMKATYEGDMTRTLKGQHKLTWTPVSLSRENVEFKTHLKWNGYMDGGVAYLVTHVYAPMPVTVKLQTNNPHGKIGFSGQLNGALLPTDPKNKDRIDPEAPLALKVGWNELLLRYNYYYGTNEYGASLVADPAALWKLKISGPVPATP